MSDTGSIVGKLINQQDGLPIPGADLKLEIEGGSWTTTSSDRGDFQFDDLKAGKYELVARKSGFEDGLWAPIAVIAGTPTTLTIALQPTPP